MNELSKAVEVAGTEYVVMAVDAQAQYKILQKLSRYGAGTLVAEMVKIEAEGGDIKTAFVKAILAIIQLMPDDDQDYCIAEALRKTTIKNSSVTVELSNFSGRISEYALLGAKAIGVQLGDFTCFLSLIPKSTAKAQEESESTIRR